MFDVYWADLKKTQKELERTEGKFARLNAISELIEASSPGLKKMHRMNSLFEQILDKVTSEQWFAKVHMYMKPFIVVSIGTMFQIELIKDSAKFLSCKENSYFVKEVVKFNSFKYAIFVFVKTLNIKFLRIKKGFYYYVLNLSKISLTIRFYLSYSMLSTPLELS